MLSCQIINLKKKFSQTANITLPISWWAFTKILFRSTINNEFCIRDYGKPSWSKIWILPNMSVSIYGYPEKAKEWEWSPVTTISVSFLSVSSTALLTASANTKVSSKALYAMLSWWAWSILPPAKINVNRGFQIIN